MGVNEILFVVLTASIFLCIVSIVAYMVIQRIYLKSQTNKDESYYKNLISTTKRKTQKYHVNKFYIKSYIRFYKIPFLKSYVTNIRKKIAAIHSYDENTMRKETMKITFLTLGSVIGAIVLLFIFNRSISFVFFVILGAVVFNNVLIDYFINRVEFRLLKQQVLLNEDTRHYYHQTGMVDEAIYEATLHAKYETSLHGEKIYQILTSNKPYEDLEHYYETAPNRFLKAFAGISFLVREFGDKKTEKGSLYLDALNKLTHENNIEILRREKLSYLLKSLSTIAIIPILFINPIENWGKNYFPIMNNFYDSKIGVFTKISIFVVILMSYLLIRKLQENDEGKYAAKVKKKRWEQWMYQIPVIKWVVDRFVPAPHSKERFRITTLLQDTNSPVTLEWFYLRRILLGGICFLLTFSMFLYLQFRSIHNILYVPPQMNAVFAKLDPKEQLKANELTNFDREVLQKHKNGKSDARERISEIVSNSTTLSTEQKNVTVARIEAKLQKLNNEYFKWWQLLICIIIGYMGYISPSWMLSFQKRIREMDMQNEVDQFHTIISILSQFERISVENILEWMERFSTVFKAPLQKCLLNYESGAEKALEQLKDDSPYVPFKRIVDRLEVSLSRIPIKEAFDDLDTEIVFYQEKRKQYYEKVIEQKASWGQLIGFTPAYALVFLYLVLPLLYESIMQMGTYLDKLKSL